MVVAMATAMAHQFLSPCSSPSSDVFSSLSQSSHISCFFPTKRKVIAIPFQEGKLPTRLRHSRIKWQIKACSSSPTEVETDLSTSNSEMNLQNNASSTQNPGPFLPRRDFKKRPHRMLILKPPLEDSKLAQRILNSPQLALKAYPLLSSCLPPAPFRQADHEWIDANLLEIKDALGYPLEGLENPPEDSPAVHLDSLLYLAFQHEETDRYKKAAYVRVGHSRLSFLGGYVLELAMCELMLQLHPRETPAALRERVYGLTNKLAMVNCIKSAGLDQVIFTDRLIHEVKRNPREAACKEVFLALIGAVYVTLGMPEVYRVLFEVFGFNLDAKHCQPKDRICGEDLDNVAPEFEAASLTWKDVALYKAPFDGLFAHPRLYRACVPPGIYRFRYNVWDVTSLPYVQGVFGYPLTIRSDIPEVAAARKVEVQLGLQLCFLHPSKYKREHPRFCNERLEYIGSKIQDVVMAEKLLMKQLDGPGLFLTRIHRKLLLNRICGRHLREKRLQRHIVYSEAREPIFEVSRRLRNFSTTGVQQAIHGLGYLVYGKSEVRRLMFEVFNVEEPLPIHGKPDSLLNSPLRPHGAASNRPPSGVAKVGPQKWGVPVQKASPVTLNS